MKVEREQTYDMHWRLLIQFSLYTMSISSIVDLELMIDYKYVCHSAVRVMMS